MAKLGARGRSELVRLEWERDVPGEDLVDWRRTTVALMSDGKVLKKSDVRFKSDQKKHSYGWKVIGKTAMTPEKFSEHYAAKGFTVTR